MNYLDILVKNSLSKGTHFIYLKGRKSRGEIERKKESFIFRFTPYLAAVAGAAPGQSQKPGAQSQSSTWEVEPQALVLS